MTAAKQAIIVVGGAGALGKSLINSLRTSPGSSASSIISVDFFPNPRATHSVPLMATIGSITWPETAMQALAKVRACLKDEGGSEMPCRAVLHVAGGWSGGGVHDPGFLESMNRMWICNVQSAALAAHMAGLYLRPQYPSVGRQAGMGDATRDVGDGGTKSGGLMVLTGAGAAVDPKACVSMVGYGLSKSATHFLTRTVAVDPEVVRAGLTALSILPTTIDTPANRMVMPDADFGEWTRVGFGRGERKIHGERAHGCSIWSLMGTYLPLQPEIIAERLVTWVEDASQRPASGSLIRVRMQECALLQ